MSNALAKERTEREGRANFQKRVEDLENRVTALENHLDAAELERKIAQGTKSS